MLKRLGWIGCCLAAGLLLQIAVQIQTVGWLPDFPIYPVLAALAAAVALFATPFAAWRGGWLVWLSGAMFVALAIAHAGLAASSSSSALEWWRNLALWPALVAGVTTCLLAGPRWPKSLFVIWGAGETAVAILASWYATSAGESQSLRAYQFVLFAALITLAASIPLLVFQNRVRWMLAPMLVLPPAGLVIACLAQSDPEQAQSLMLAVATLRSGLFMLASLLWLSADESPVSPTESAYNPTA